MSSQASDAPRGWRHTIRDLIREARLAIAMLTLWPLDAAAAGAGSEERARAMALLPLVGLGAGVGLALVDRKLAASFAPLIRSAMLIAFTLIVTRGLHLIALTRTLQRLERPAGSETEGGMAARAVAAAAIMAEMLALASITAPAARARTIVLALMLSRWAMVPIAYGLRPLERDGLGVPYDGGITFREFALASVVAMGLAMAMYDLVALAAIVPLGLAILGLRLLFSRRLGGVGGFELGASAAICELIVIAVLAAIPS